MSKSKSKIDFYCHYCESYFILKDLEKPSCKFCQSTFVESIKRKDLPFIDYDDYYDLEGEMYKVGKCTRSRNEKYVLTHGPAHNSNLINMGSKVFLARNANENYLFPTESATDTNIPKVITDSQIDSLPTMDILSCSNFGDSCSICSNEFSEVTDIVKTLDCGHQFHRMCIRNWLSQKKECPVCRHLVIFQNSGINNSKRSFSSVVVNGNRANGSFTRDTASSSDNQKM